MAETLATVVVVPRERFSASPAALESIFRNTEPPFDLVYVDGNSPEPIRSWLAEQARSRGFRLLRTDHYLSPNQARNLAWEEVRTRHVVFVDNDVLVEPDWLGHLVRCAEETGAWVVSPLCFQGSASERVIHICGGDARFTEHAGGRHFTERHRRLGQRYDAVAGELRREPTDFVEFHCFLMRRELRDRLGPLDEQFLSTRDHHDFSLAVVEAGGTMLVEPRSMITYETSLPFEDYDLEYFRLRWSDDWNRRSLQRFREKWGLAADDPAEARHLRWCSHHRGLVDKSRMPRWLRRLRTRARAQLVGGVRWIRRQVGSRAEAA